MSSSEAKEMVSAAILATIPKKKVAAYQKALGALVIDLSLLHFLLERYFWTLTGNDEVSGGILTRNLTFAGLLEKMEEIAKHRIRDVAQLKTLVSILRDTAKLNEERNGLVHALWVIDDNEPVFCLRRKKGKPDEVAPAPENIDELVQKVLDVTIEFIDYKKRIPSGFDEALKGLLGLGAK